MYSPLYTAGYCKKNVAKYEVLARDDVVYRGGRVARLGRIGRVDGVVHCIV